MQNELNEEYTTDFGLLDGDKLTAEELAAIERMGGATTVDCDGRYPDGTQLEEVLEPTNIKEWWKNQGEAALGGVFIAICDLDTDDPQVQAAMNRLVRVALMARDRFSKAAEAA